MRCAWGTGWLAGDGGDAMQITGHTVIDTDREFPEGIEVLPGGHLELRHGAHLRLGGNLEIRGGRLSSSPTYTIEPYYARRSLAPGSHVSPWPNARLLVPDTETVPNNRRTPRGDYAGNHKTEFPVADLDGLFTVQHAHPAGRYIDVPVARLDRPIKISSLDPDVFRATVNVSATSDLHISGIEFDKSLGRVSLAPMDGSGIHKDFLDGDMPGMTPMGSPLCLMGLTGTPDTVRKIDGERYAWSVRHCSFPGDMSRAWAVMLNADHGLFEGNVVACWQGANVVVHKLAFGNTIRGNFIAGGFTNDPSEYTTAQPGMPGFYATHRGGHGIAAWTFFNLFEHNVFTFAGTVSAKKFGLNINALHMDAWGRAEPRYYSGGLGLARTVRRGDVSPPLNAHRWIGLPAAGDGFVVARGNRYLGFGPNGLAVWGRDMGRRGAPGGHAYDRLYFGTTEHPEVFGNHYRSDYGSYGNDGIVVHVKSGGQEPEATNPNHGLDTVVTSAGYSNGNVELHVHGGCFARCVADIPAQLWRPWHIHIHDKVELLPVTRGLAASLIRWIPMGNHDDIISGTEAEIRERFSTTREVHIWLHAEQDVPLDKAVLCHVPANFHELEGHIPIEQDDLLIHTHDGQTYRMTWAGDGEYATPTLIGEAPSPEPTPEPEPEPTPYALWDEYDRQRAIRDEAQAAIDRIFKTLKEIRSGD